LKETNPNLHITVNTNYPELLNNNPFVNVVGSERVGTKLTYPDPIHCKEPTCHHIISDWKIVTKEYGIRTELPILRPEIYLPAIKCGGEIGVQTIHKGQWGGKKVWPYFHKLAEYYTPIPRVKSIIMLAELIASYRMVVCSEGGISHIAKAVGTPAIVIYGGWASPEWNGYADQVNIICRPSCSYCYNSHKCKEYFKCLTKISVQYVIENVGTLLGV